MNNNETLNHESSKTGGLWALIKKHQSFFRFVIVGFINTANYYMLYLLLMATSLPYISSHSIAFGISMIGSFYLNCYFTYKTKPTLKKFLQFPMTYIFNYSVATLSLFVLVDLLEMNTFAAPMLAAIIPIPCTYLISKWILVK